MSDASADADRIAQLLRQGLDDYGHGDVDEAVTAWREVLSLDPQNADALDFIESAGRQDGEAAAGASGDLEPVIGEAMGLAAAGGLRDAYDLLAGSGGDSLEHAAAVDTLRAQLIERDRMAFAAYGIAALTGDPSAMQDINLPPDAGFLLSLVDGMTPVADLVSLSGMDPFDAFRMLRGLVDARIVEVRS